MYDILYKLYQVGRISIVGLQNAVNKNGISANQMEEIIASKSN